MRDSYMFYTDKLEGEYKDAFRQIDSYVNAERIDEDTQEEYMGQLLDVFLIAQQERKPIAKIIGTDIERFCKSFCEDFTWKTKILAAIDMWKNFAWVIFVMSTLEVLSVLYVMNNPGGEEINFWTEPYEFNFIGYLLAFMMASICATILSRFIRKGMFKMKKVSMRVWQMINWFGAAVIFLIMLAVFFSNENFIQFPGWSLMLGSGVVLLIYYILNRERVKERGETKVKFWDKVAEGVGEDVPKVEIERFERKNKKQIRKGKPVLTWKEFVDMEEKQYLLTMKLEWVLKLLPVVLVARSLWNDVINQNYANWIDFLISYGVLIPLYIVYINGINKVYNTSMKAQKDWIDKERMKLEAAEENCDER